MYLGLYQLCICRCSSITSILNCCILGTSAVFQAAPDALSKAYDKEMEYEQRVCRFLEQTKGDSEYEEKVRKFLEETARW
jgi:hypothetical protein